MYNKNCIKKTVPLSLWEIWGISMCSAGHGYCLVINWTITELLLYNDTEKRLPKPRDNCTSWNVSSSLHLDLKRTVLRMAVWSFEISSNMKLEELFSLCRKGTDHRNLNWKGSVLPMTSLVSSVTLATFSMKDSTSTNLSDAPSPKKAMKGWQLCLKSRHSHGFSSVYSYKQMDL